MKKGLVILVGGRTITNVLAAQNLRPDVIVPVGSQESLKPGEAWSQMEAVLHRLCPTGLCEPLPVNGFSLEQVKAACEKALNEHSDTEWFFNLTPATKIMSFGAYEVARSQNASAWYLDSDSSQTIVLCGKPPDGNLYKLSVADYLASYGRTITAIGQTPPDQKLIDFARRLAKRPDEAMKFRDTLRNSGFSQVKQHQTKQERLNAQARFLPGICEEAKKAGLVADWQNKSGVIELSVTGCVLWQFLNGLWLEVYAYDAARQANCFEDVQYSLTTPGEHGENQIDLLATRNGVLLIAECKTEKPKNPEKKFSPEHLDKLTAIASLIGDDYVGRVFISSQTVPPEDKALSQSFVDFCDQAKARRIIVVKGEELEDLPNILRGQALKPTYARV